MTKTPITSLPATPSNQPTAAACTCGKYDFLGLDNANMRLAIADHFKFSALHQ